MNDARSTRSALTATGLLLCSPFLLSLELWATPQAADAVSRALAEARARPAEMRWRLLPWMHSLKKALARGKQENKPIFYFGYDGVLDTGNS